MIDKKYNDWLDKIKLRKSSMKLVYKYLNEVSRIRFTIINPYLLLVLLLVIFLLYNISVILKSLKIGLAITVDSTLN